MTFQNYESAIHLLDDFNSETVSFAGNVEAGAFHLGAVELRPLEKKLMLAPGWRDGSRSAGSGIVSRIGPAGSSPVLIPFESGRHDLLQILRGRSLDAGKKYAADLWRSTKTVLLSLTSKTHPPTLACLQECTKVRHARRATSSGGS
ncbi:hypothetical protein BKA70DRAFT_1560734 [Coprinopsis sp. MPI-PUGE-AT-0042]|nr:hypothetical protein BKA70DRAFT_1560734 [Coprinopsis sp. MPI-PUGE-AT-0042]